MSKFDTQIHCEEITTYQPTAADWEEYHAWLDSQEAAKLWPEPDEDFQLSAPEGWDDDADDSIGELDTIDEYEWTEEAIAWEEGMRSDNLYDDEDFDDIGDNELYEDRYNGEPFEDTYNDYDAWEAYCDYE